MFSKSTRFTHESRVSTKPWPMHPPPPPLCHARDLSRAFWLARTQTPRIVRLHRWILLDRTAILIPFDSTCKCFQIAPSRIFFPNSTRFTHESRVPTKPWPMPPFAARVTWVVRSDWPEPKPHGSYVCRWMLLDRTTILIPFDRKCSPARIWFICQNARYMPKNFLNIAHETWNTPANQTRGIMVISYRGNKIKA